MCMFVAKYLIVIMRVLQMDNSHSTLENGTTSKTTLVFLVQGHAAPTTSYMHPL